MPVVVAYEGGAHFIGELRARGISRHLGRRLQRFTVTIPQRQAAVLAGGGAIKEESPGLFVQVDPRLYDERFGLITSIPEYEPEGLMA